MQFNEYHFILRLSSLCSSDLNQDLINSMKTLAASFKNLDCYLTTLSFGGMVRAHPDSILCTLSLHSAFKTQEMKLIIHLLKAVSCQLSACISSASDVIDLTELDATVKSLIIKRTVGTDGLSFFWS